MDLYSGTNLEKRNGGGCGTKELKLNGVDFTKEHKWNLMKDQWKMWKVLKENKTGLGWDIT